MGMMEATEKEVQTLEQLYALRKQAVRLHKSGMRVMQIVTATGLLAERTHGTELV